MSMLYTAVHAFLYILELAIFFYCILTWVAPRSALCGWLANFIAPFCMPFRRLGRYCMSRWGAPVDFTCLFAIIGLRIADSVIRRIFIFLIRLF